MRKLVFLVLMLCFPFLANAQEAEKQKLIHDALLPLPEHLRESAVVAIYDEVGNRTVLREGSGEIICQADDPTPAFFVYCFHRSSEPHVVRRRKWASEGKSQEEITELQLAAMKEGKLAREQVGAAGYILQGANALSATPLMVIRVPNATAESTGLSTTPSNFRPWLMLPGTPLAHVMMPGN